MKTNSIIINGTEILISNNGTEKIVAIKPICKALGIAYSRQFTKIKEDSSLGSRVTSGITTGADGKSYEMVHLPLKYIFGWLFTINPENVNPDVKQQIINYRELCYEKLFDSFTKRDNLLKEKVLYQIQIEKLEDELKTDSRYIEIQKLKSSIKITSQQFNDLNKDVINNQLDLFKNQQENQD